MRKVAILIVFTICMLNIQYFINGQVVNINPDPNGTPWITGGVPNLTPEKLEEIYRIPSMTLISSIDPPDSVDNSKNIYMRPIFEQVHGSCAQASGIGYVFTYEINWMRNLAACDSVDEANWYPTHFTYNFLNEGDGEKGSYVDDGWDIVTESGCPTVPIYGGMHVNEDATHWMTGYDNYLQALENRVDYYEKINFDTLQEDALDLLKQWLFNHNDDNEEAGGLASFCIKMDFLTYDIFPEDSPESGKWLVSSWNDDDSALFHQLTVVGYHDSVCYDFNNDGNYTNDTIINGDTVLKKYA